MMRSFWQVHLVRAGLVAAAIGAALLAAALRRALRMEDVSADLSPLVQGTAPQPGPSTGYAVDRVLGAVAKDPFHPERRRPGARFRLPVARIATPRQERPRPNASELRLVGTAVGAEGGGFAMCAWQGCTPRIVRIGERIGEWTLQSVSPGAAEFVTPGGPITVRVPKVGA